VRSPFHWGGYVPIGKLEAQAAAFVKQADTLMKAGRPICPWCSQPKDPSGHACPRSNGHVLH